MTTDILTCGECARRTADVRKREGGPAYPLCNLCWQLGQRLAAGIFPGARCPYCEGPLNLDGSCAASCVGVGDPT